MTNNFPIGTLPFNSTNLLCSMFFCYCISSLFYKDINLLYLLVYKIFITSYIVFQVLINQIDREYSTLVEKRML